MLNDEVELTLESVGILVVGHICMMFHLGWLVTISASLNRLPYLSKLFQGASQLSSQEIRTSVTSS